jgi:hypothetical protein
MMFLGGVLTIPQVRANIPAELFHSGYEGTRDITITAASLILSLAGIYTYYTRCYAFIKYWLLAEFHYWLWIAVLLFLHTPFDLAFGFTVLFASISWHGFKITISTRKTYLSKRATE